MIKAKSARYLARGKPARRPRLRNEDDHTIVSVYGAEYRGIVQYYLLAGNVARLYRLQWVMETSMLKTLAASTARRCRRWPASTRPPSTRRTGRASAWKPGSNAAAGSHWSHGSAASRSTAEDAVLTDRSPGPGHYPP